MIIVKMILLVLWVKFAMETNALVNDYIFNNNNKIWLIIFEFKDGCRNDANCRFEEACVSKKCQNPCTLYGACGVNAICKPLNHDRVCSCVPDYTGDPKILCERIVTPPECTSDSQCPLENLCQNQRCIGMFINRIKK